MDLDRWLNGTRLIVTVGSGGVGKTTTAAAIALYAARQGRKAMVLTIDPARRLANSLGLESMGGEAKVIDLSAIEGAKGTLSAMMLDSRSTFDNLIHSIAPSPEVRDRILANHVYKAMAGAFAGSQDYMATEQVYDLVESGEYDLVVLDTPPVKNALDFLESPGRVVNFLDEKVMKWFVNPVEKKSGLLAWSSRFVRGASNLVYRLLDPIFGAEFLEDFVVFIGDFKVLLEGFRQRHLAVLELLKSQETAFVTVTAPTEGSMDIATFFEQELLARGLPRAGVVVNQVHQVAPALQSADEILGIYGLSEDQRESLAEGLEESLHELMELCAAERQLIHRLSPETAGSFLREVPRLRGEVHDLLALAKVGELLFQGE